MKTSAAVLHKVGSELRIEEAEVGPLRPGDVLVRVRASGLCHTEWEVMQGAIASPMPIVMGHEGAGIVEQVGPGVERVRPGDHVVCSWNPNCGRCFYCIEDQPILCERLASAAPRAAMPDGSFRLSLAGAPLHQFSWVAAHAEYTVVNQAGAVAVPRDIPFDRACLIGCGVLTGVGGAIRIARVAVGSSAVTFGCGAVGLNVVQGVRLAQAYRNIAVDVNPRRLELAAALGATDTIDASQTDAVEAVRRLTNGRGADYTFEAGGLEATMQQAIEASRPGGTVVILGKVPVGNYIRLRFGSLMGERRITRSSYGGARPARDLPLLARYYLDGALKLDELITRRIRLDEINDAFASLARGETIRSVVTFA
jgi:S-(hydroxymethyl)glutathione dehydrogenase/alcohol dehydrogenase